MSNGERSGNTALVASSTARATRALAAAQRAVTRLEARGVPVTFAAVAEEGGVSLSYVYKNDAVAKRIRELRGMTSAPRKPRTSRNPSAEGLQTKLAAVVARNRELESEVTRLRAENRNLLSRMMKVP